MAPEPSSLATGTILPAPDHPPPVPPPEFASQGRQPRSPSRTVSEGGDKLGGTGPRSGLKYGVRSQLSRSNTMPMPDSPPLAGGGGAEDRPRETKPPRRMFSTSREFAGMHRDNSMFSERSTNSVTGSGALADGFNANSKSLLDGNRITSIEALISSVASLKYYPGSGTTTSTSSGVTSRASDSTGSKITSTSQPFDGNTVLFDPNDHFFSPTESETPTEYDGSRIPTRRATAEEHLAKTPRPVAWGSTNVGPPPPATTNQLIPSLLFSALHSVQASGLSGSSMNLDSSFNSVSGHPSPLIVTVSPRTGPRFDLTMSSPGASTAALHSRNQSLSRGSVYDFTLGTDLASSGAMGGSQLLLGASGGGSDMPSIRIDGSNMSLAHFPSSTGTARRMSSIQLPEISLDGGISITLSEAPGDDSNDRDRDRDSPRSSTGASRGSSSERVPRSPQISVTIPSGALGLFLDVGDGAPEPAPLGAAPKPVSLFSLHDGNKLSAHDLSRTPEMPTMNLTPRDTGMGAGRSLLVGALDGSTAWSSVSLNIAEPVSPFTLPDAVYEDPAFTRVRESVHPKPTTRLAKFNSCSSLHILATPCNSDLRDMVNLVACGLHDMILDAHRSRNFRTHRLFSEDIFPLIRGQSVSHPFNPPTCDAVFNFLFSIFDAAQLGSEICIITLVYLDRMLTNSRLNIFSANWPRMVLGALLLAAKVWDDQAVWNVDFCTLFPDLRVKDTNELERFFIESLHFNVSVRPAVFARYYFALHDKFGALAPKPISVRAAIKLHAYPRAGRDPVTQLPELRVNPPAPRAFSPATASSPALADEYEGPDGLAAPASLDGVVPTMPTAMAAQRITGMRRVRSDYTFAETVPASIM
ncbi:hypothetical protein H9P43_003307 [Blastocladiella emersonii ATCC 22665]|nr:hypothetical protein H9P43_003307 [Blastocladiella emersonii ATCC 22665]